MKTSLFDYHLPAERIAQQPMEPRDASRLLVLHRASGVIEHRRFHEIGDYLQPGDLLVANNSRVIPARLLARKETGGQAEIFLLRRVEDSLETSVESASQSLDAISSRAPDTVWQCLVRGRNIRAGASLTILPQSAGNQTDHEQEKRDVFGAAVTARVLAEDDSGVRTIVFDQPVAQFVETAGQVPLPPYITEYSGDPERYQTVFNQSPGSVAAPTAGLHFTPDLLLALRQQGIQFHTVTLHVGLDTFRPVEVEDAAEHPIHTEWAELPAPTAQAVNQAALAGKRTIAVGTTAVRTLEWGAQLAAPRAGSSAKDLIDAPFEGQGCPWQRVAAFSNSVNLFIRPGYRYRAVDALITNFHLPRSTLLMLVSAFAAQPHPRDHDKGRRMILAAYREAIDMGYRFYSFGDAMLIL